MIYVALTPPIVHGMDQARPQSVQAIWRVQELRLTFFSTTVHYTCGALKAKVAAVLMLLGARETPLIHIANCTSDRGLMNAASMRITIRVPAAADESSVRAATALGSRERLVARIRGESLPTEADLEYFPATWRWMALYRHPQLRLTPGDCELLRAMRDQLLPALAVRVVRDGLHCASGTRIRPQLEVEALLSAHGASTSAP
jgi:hypothetical protein